MTIHGLGRSSPLKDRCRSLGQSEGTTRGLPDRARCQGLEPGYARHLERPGGKIRLLCTVRLGRWAEKLRSLCGQRICSYSELVRTDRYAFSENPKNSTRIYAGQAKNARLTRKMPWFFCNRWFLFFFFSSLFFKAVKGGQCDRELFNEGRAEG